MEESTTRHQSDPERPVSAATENGNGPNPLSSLPTDAHDRQHLFDEQGPIPSFPPVKLDEHGRIIPMSDEEREAREVAYHRIMKILDAMDDDPLGSDEEFMRAFDSRRPEGFKLFEGYY